MSLATGETNTPYLIALLVVVGGALWFIDLDEEILAQGYFRPASISALDAPVEAIVDQVHAASGSTVAPGQLLMRLRSIPEMEQREELMETIQLLESLSAGISRSLKHEVELKMMDVEQAKLDRDVSVIQYNSARRLWRRGALPRKRVTANRARLRRAKEGLDSVQEAAKNASLAYQSFEKHQVFVGIDGSFVDLRDRLDLLKYQLGELRRYEQSLEVLASAPGVILDESPENLVGQIVNRGDGLLSIANYNALELVLFVRPRDIATVRVGQTVKALPHLAGLKTAFVGRGRIVDVRPSVLTDKGRAFPLLVALEDASIPLDEKGRQHVTRAFSAVSARIKIGEGNIYRQVLRMLKRFAVQDA